MPEPVRVVATLHCRPGQGNRAVLAMRDCVRETRAEPGCIEYAAYREDDAADRITVVELWASRAALDAHAGSPHLKKLADAVTPLLASPLEVLVLKEIG